MRIPRRKVGKIGDGNNEHLVINAHIEDTIKAFQSIEFGNGTAGGSENINCDFYVFTDSGSAGTEVSASHALNRVPIGALLIKQNKAGSIYWSTAPTSAAFYFESDAANLSGTILLI